MLRILVAATLLGLAFPQTASADLGCGPAVQNWSNGSRTTCPFDSGGGPSDSNGSTTVVVVEPPVVVDECGDKWEKKTFKRSKRFSRKTSNDS